MSETIKTDGSSFLAASFAEMFAEMKKRDSTYVVLTRDDGDALALLTQNPSLVKRIECAIQKHEDARAAAAAEEADHAGN